LADGYFILPYTIADYLATVGSYPAAIDQSTLKDIQRSVGTRVQRLLSTNGHLPADHFHRELGRLMWEHCGMSRSASSLRKALDDIRRIRERFWRELRITGGGSDFNQELEKAGRVADFLEFAELVCLDALQRDESCGAHFREEHQTPDGEAQRDDQRFAHVAAWEYTGDGQPPRLHREALTFEYVHLAQRSYR
jgi:succinate dehydrogenase / fumarate reductase flavoprotein subunit